jgi:hypothetical protein
LAHISEGYAAGQLDTVVHSLLTKRRIERLRAMPVDIPEILQWLCKVRARSGLGSGASEGPRQGD